MVVQEKIQIIVETIATGLGNLKSISNNYGAFTNNIQSAQQVARGFGISVRELNKNLGEQGLRLQDVTTKGIGFSRNVGSTGVNLGQMGKHAGVAFGGISKVGKGIYNLYQKSKQFKPQWLSLMFISMGLGKAFQTMVAPIMDAIGVSDILNTIFLVIMLPVLDTLLTVILTLMDYFLNLPEPIQKMIATGILFGVALFGIVIALSQVVLLVSSLGIACGAFLAFIVPLVTALGGATLAVKFLGEGAGTMADTVVEAISGLVDQGVVFINKFATFFEENKDKIIAIGNKLLKAVLEGFLTILDTLDPVVKSFLEVLTKFYEDNKDYLFRIARRIINWIIQFAMVFMPLIVELGLTIITAVAEGINNNMKEIIRPSILKLINVLSDFITEFAPQFTQLGIDLIGAIAKGILENPKAIFIALMTVLGAVLGAFIGMPGLGAIVGLMAGGAIFNAFEGGGKKKSKQDFVWRPGSAPMSFSPNDTVVGTKNGTSGGNNATINFSPVYNVNLSDKATFERMIESNNRKMVDDLRRLIET